MGDKQETRPSGKQTHHPTNGNKRGRGDKGTQDPQEGGHTIGKADAIQPREQERVQWETRPSGRGTDHPKIGNKKWHNGNKGEKTLREGGHTIQNPAKSLRKH